MAPFADLANVSCKVSGLVLGEAEQLVPFVNRLAGWFGGDRLLFGSDWPVCLLGATYGEIVERLRAVLDAVPEAARGGVMGANAARVYRLPAS